MIRLLRNIHPKNWKFQIELDLELAVFLMLFIAGLSYLAHCHDNDACIDWLLKWFA